MTSTPPTHLSEREMLVRACWQNDTDDTPRLVYADWLESRDTVYVKCSRCKGKGRINRPSTLYGGKMETCGLCKGNREIPDDTEARHAELLRVQCEEARTPLCGGGDIINDRHCKNCSRVCNLRARAVYLLPALRDRLLPACWQCDGDKHIPTTSVGVSAPCLECNTSARGRCPGTFERGLPVVTVPLAVLGEEREQIGATTNRVVSRKWHPSDFARTCVRMGAGFRVTDREPRSSVNYPGEVLLVDTELHTMPEAIGKSLAEHLSGFNRKEAHTMNNNHYYFDTAAAAVRALSSALWRCAVAGA